SAGWGVAGVTGGPAWGGVVITGGRGAGRAQICGAVFGPQICMGGATGSGAVPVPGLRAVVLGRLEAFGAAGAGPRRSASLNSSFAISVPLRRTTVLFPTVSDQLTLASETPVGLWGSVPKRENCNVASRDLMVTKSV